MIYYEMLKMFFSFQTSSSTKTTTMTTPAKLYGKDLSEYEEIDVDELLNKLTADEINLLAKEVDPDVSNKKRNCRLGFKNERPSHSDV